MLSLQANNGMETQIHFKGIFFGYLISDFRLAAFSTTSAEHFHAAVQHVIFSTLKAARSITLTFATIINLLTPTEHVIFDFLHVFIHIKPFLDRA